MAAAAQYTPQNIAYFKALGAAAKARAPKPLQLPSGAQQSFGQQRIAANSQYRTGLATNAYQRSGAAQQFTRQFRDLNTNFDKQRSAMPFAANARGVLGSGIWKQQLQDYGTSRVRAMGDFQTDRTQGLGQYDIIRKNIEAQRAQALAQIEAQRQMMMGQMAPGTIK